MSLAPFPVSAEPICWLVIFYYLTKIALFAIDYSGNPALSESAIFTPYNLTNLSTFKHFFVNAWFYSWSLIFQQTYTFHHALRCLL